MYFIILITIYLIIFAFLNEFHSISDKTKDKLILQNPLPQYGNKNFDFVKKGELNGRHI